uniref:Adenylate kinase isoenzyme 6 homolog n=1 Tax=Hirondellea gigas TaxID=1518452 RepID=A0A2P2I2G8_9CRUS
MVITRPNILITGTPGVGKSTLGEEVADLLGMELVNINEMAKEQNLYDGYDDERQCHIIDEDRIIDELEEGIEEGGLVVDYHGSNFFPIRFFQAVFVLRCDNTVLYDRLAARGYNDKKIQENVECEIMNVLRDEAAESYDSKIVFELQNDTTEQMEKNVKTITDWVRDRQGDTMES